MNKKIILVTGASSGIGHACASKLHSEGHLVYGSSRTLTRLKDASFRPLEMDVTDEQSVQNAYDKILSEEGRLDVLVNNAGNGVAGPAYHMPVEIAKKQFEVNFFGVVRVSCQFLPDMISAQSGLIVNIGSLGGLFGLPYQSMYSASKFAIEGYSQSLRMELRNTGVQVVVINPGDYRSAFTVNRDKVPFRLDNEMLKAEYNAAVTSMERDESIAPDPAHLAEKLAAIIENSSRKPRYLVGQFSQTMVPALKQILPVRIFEKLMNDHYGIK